MPQTQTARAVNVRGCQIQNIRNSCQFLEIYFTTLQSRIAENRLRYAKQVMSETTAFFGSERSLEEH
jgi:thiamine kinase-like enzyme